MYPAVYIIKMCFFLNVMESASSDDFFQDRDSDWTLLNEIEYDSILVFDSNEENVPNY